jgi:hypothetical protein
MEEDFFTGHTQASIERDRDYSSATMSGEEHVVLDARQHAQRFLDVEELAGHAFHHVVDDRGGNGSRESSRGPSRPLSRRT